MKNPLDKSREDVVHYARRTLVSKIPVEVCVRRNMKFTLGRIVWTRGVNDLVADDIVFAKFVTDSLARHCIGDWVKYQNLTKRKMTSA